MCRLAAYHGSTVSLGRFLLEPPHGLLRQAYAPREMREATLNADGFGFGWFDESGRAGVYVNHVPIWNDVNLEHLGHGLRAHQWLANVRSATPPTPATPFNTMPFLGGGFLFLHNGYLQDFGDGLRARLRRELAPAYEDAIQGNTDSEHLFHWLRQIMETEGDPPLQALATATHRLGGWLEGRRALLNIVLGDGRCLVALRHAIGADCPTLYYTTAEPLWPDACVIASEPLTEASHWQPVPPHHLLLVEDGAAPRLQAL